MEFLTFKVNRIPDLSLNKYQTLSDTGVEGVLKRHSDFLRQWHGIGLSTNTSMHMLYLFDSTQKLGTRLNLYLFICADNKETLNLLRPLIHKSPLSDFYTFTESDLPDVSFAAGSTLIKNERNAEIHLPLSDRTELVHFVPHWEVDENARLYDLFRVMEVIGSAYDNSSSCAYRIDLYPVSMVNETIKSFSPIIKVLQGDNDIKLVPNAVDGKIDNYAQTVKQEYDDWMANIQTSPHFRVNAYAFADNKFTSKVILNAAASEAINEGDFSIQNIKPDENGQYSVISRLNGAPRDYCATKKANGENVSVYLPSWSTTYLLDEAIPFFRFPALFDGENIEIPKETAPEQKDGGIRIGSDTNKYEVNFPIELLPRHAFFTGAPGSGKTYTMLYFLNQLKEHNIPFLVFEPAKKEYRELVADEKMSDVYLFSPHLQSKFPLRVNPMAFPVGVSLETHIESLLTALKGSFLFEGGVYKILSASVEKAYLNKGWNIEDKNDGKHEFPTFSDVYKLFEKELNNNSSYDGDIKGNIRSFLETRLGTLMERGTGELFNTHVSTFSPEQWIEKSAVVELESLSEPAKNFFILLICTYIRETLSVDPNGCVDEKGELRPVRHVIFIEEAHNIIAPTTQQSSSDTVDPKVSATAFIVKMLAETRALREAIVIADQLPTVLAPEVTKNTGLKLIHRLTAQDDREYVGSTVSATPLQLEQVANYSKGKALFFNENTPKPFEVQVADGWKKPKIKYNYAIDDILFNSIKNRDTITHSFIKAIEDFRIRIINPLKESEKIRVDAFLEHSKNKFSLVGEADIITEEILQKDIALALQKCSYFLANIGYIYHINSNSDTDFIEATRPHISSVTDDINAIMNECRKRTETYYVFKQINRGEK